MVHLAMAHVPETSRWWLEGLSTYVESIARAQRGHLSEEFVWNGFYHRMPQGLPQDGDRGLDRTPTWGRTYWGGAMFCLLADVEIRRLTDNRKSLRDALRGSWSLSRGLRRHGRRGGEPPRGDECARIRRRSTSTSCGGISASASRTIKSSTTTTRRSRTCASAC